MQPNRCVIRRPQKLARQLELIRTYMRLAEVEKRIRQAGRERWAAVPVAAEAKAEEL